MNWKRTFILFALGTLSLTVYPACGGGSGSNEFSPRPVPTEYQGLNVEQIKAKSKGLVYTDLIIDRGDWRSKPHVEEHLNTKIGELVWFEGRIDKIYDGSEPNVFQAWICTGDKVGTTQVGDKCTDPIFALYSNERGPELLESKFVQIAGVVVGNHKRPISTGEHNWSFRAYTPLISVIRAQSTPD